MNVTRAMFGGTVFLAAFLLFAVEPMAAKQLLPVLGGSSAVWVTCLVFFQGMLLVGYLYAHWMTRQGRVWVHVAVLGAAAALLGMLWLMGMVLRAEGVSVHWDASVSDHPVLTIFEALGVTIGLPFLLLGSTGPMLQVWLARREGGGVLYRLFALSNVGSLLALVLYPTVIEPRLTLAAQREWWGVGFCLYAAVCGWLGWRVGFGVDRRKAVRALREYPTLRDETAKSGAPDLVAVGVAGFSAAAASALGPSTSLGVEMTVLGEG